VSEQAIGAVSLGSENALGEVIHPGDDGYDEARSVFNAMIDKRPALIVRPAHAAQVIETVNLARERRLPLAVRCGQTS
jgi:FAD/FMN-containing dehydrogenase